MIRYWFEFDLKNYNNPPMGIRLGCGITAQHKEQAIEFLQKKIFDNQVIPPIVRCVENIDISKLDASHVIPNMHSPVKKGIWFPLGYE